MSRLFVGGLAALSLIACQPHLLPPAGGGRATTAPTAPILLQGRVAFPGFAVQAQPGEVTGHAGIALIDGAGVTRAGGVTDATGAFTLYQSDPPYVPVDGDFYTLEASRRSANGAMLTLRTTLQRQGTGWTSITGSTVVINLTTTAIAAIDAEDAAVTPLQTMATVSGAAYDQVTAIGTWTTTHIAGRVTALTAVLASNEDPNNSQTYPATGALTISSPEMLQNVQHVTTANGAMAITTNDVTTLSLPRLREVNTALAVTNRTNLTTISLPSLRSVTGTIIIQNNAALETLSLPNLTSVTGAILISNNPALTTISLPSLRTVTANFGISNNTGLIHLPSMPHLTTVGGNLAITGNTALSDVGAFSALTNVGNALTIAGSQVTNLGAFSALTSVGNALSISSNSALTSLAGLANLTSIGDELYIDANGALENLGMSGLNTVTGALTITNNPSLPTAQAEALHVQIGSPAGETISGNAP